MSYYNDNDFRDYLAHHGILGQKWGKRNGPPYPLGYGDHTAFQKKKENWEKSLERSKSKNLSKWGNDPEHNVLYLTGLSGSGKSTVAIGLAKKTNSSIIHLDSYLSPMSEESRNDMQNKDFNMYLDKHVPGWNKMIRSSGTLDYKIVDKFAKAIDNYAAEKYKNKKKVIAEGVQLFDETLHEKRSYYADKPYMCLTTSALTSLVRGNIRDEMNGLDFFYRIPMYMKTSKIQANAIKELELKGMKWCETNEILRSKSK